MILTKNEKCVLRLLATTVGKNMSMNDIGKACAVTSGGAYKILTKLEKEGVLKATAISNLKAYKLDFGNEKTSRVLELALMSDLEGRVKLRADDLKQLKPVTKACILFGSYITTKKEPGDLDVLFILEKKGFEAYKKAITKAQDIIPIKIQDVVQTTDDLQKNLRNNDPIVTEALRNGTILWGFDVIVRVVKNVSQ